MMYTEQAIFKWQTAHTHTRAQTGTHACARAPDKCSSDASLITYTGTSIKADGEIDCYALNSFKAFIGTLCTRPILNRNERQQQQIPKPLLKRRQKFNYIQIIFKWLECVNTNDWPLSFVMVRMDDLSFNANQFIQKEILQQICHRFKHEFAIGPCNCSNCFQYALVNSTHANCLVLEQYISSTVAPLIIIIVDNFVPL